MYNIVMSRLILLKCTDFYSSQKFWNLPGFISLAEITFYGKCHILRLESETSLALKDLSGQSE